MCTYCGCEAQTSIRDLMRDHAVIAQLSSSIMDALDEVATLRLESLVEQLAERFLLHSRIEEAGLFAELRAAGEAGTELAGLVSDHARLQASLSDPRIATQRDQLIATLEELRSHAELEDTDLFPFALQVLPTSSWERIEAQVARTQPVGADAAGAS